MPLLVAIEGGTGQLFFTSARGWPSARDAANADRRPYYDLT